MFLVVSFELKCRDSWFWCSDAVCAVAVSGKQSQEADQIQNFYTGFVVIARD